jgi:hypothetical protein
LTWKDASTVVGSLKGVYPNSWAGFCFADSSSAYVENFPAGASADHKGLLLAGLLLFEYQLFNHENKIDGS